MITSPTVGEQYEYWESGVVAIVTVLEDRSDAVYIRYVLRVDKYLQGEEFATSPFTWGWSREFGPMYTGTLYPLDRGNPFQPPEVHRELGRRAIR